jgi:hypothetical protein
MRLLFLFLVLYGPVALAQKDCELRRDDRGVKVYTCHSDSSRFKSIVAAFDIKATLAELRDALLNVSEYPQWQYNTTKTEILDRPGPDEVVYHSFIDAPWPASNRDMIVRLQLTKQENGLEVSARNDPRFLPEVKGVVRVPSSFSQWTVSQGDGVLHCRYELQIDPGGNVPPWLVNWACAQGPYDSFTKLKERLEKASKK